MCAFWTGLPGVMKRRRTPWVFRPLGERPAYELGTVVEDELFGPPTGLGETIEYLDHPGAGE